MTILHMAVVLAVLHRALRVQRDQREPVRILARSRCNSR
jgi:hypothetical protein